MSQFNYADYQKIIEQAQSGGSNGISVGFFKLKDDGDQALVRIDCNSLEELEFASVHTINTNGRWMKVSCLNPLGNYGDKCALCTAAAQGNHSAVSKASKKVYLKMLVSYKDKTTGQFTPAVPVVWERPAAFSRDIATLIKTYSDAGIDLRNVLLTITRNGKVGDMKTTYSLIPAPEAIFKPEMIPADFSAFNNFNIARHSYWEKTPEEINTYLMTGSFDSNNTTQTINTAPVNKVGSVSTNPPFTAPYTVTDNTNMPATTTAVPTIPTTSSVGGNTTLPNVSMAASTPSGNQVGTPSVDAARPVRNFNGFSF